jgi:hypothetical protein
VQRVESSRVIAASPEDLYDIVSDLPRMGELSEEHIGGEWIGSATHPDVGAKFKGRNANGRRTWSTIATVDVAEPGRQFTFGVTAGPFKISRWSFRFESVEHGTNVTQTWEDQRTMWMKALGGVVSGVSNRTTANRSAIEHTLSMLAARAEI